MIDGYTFAKLYHNTWGCSTRKVECKAKVKMSSEGDIIFINNEHCHPPKKYVKTKSGQYITYSGR